MSSSPLWSLLAPWITGVWVAYLVLLATWIVLQKREPIATLRTVAEKGGKPGGVIAVMR